MHRRLAVLPGSAALAVAFALAVAGPVLDPEAARRLLQLLLVGLVLAALALGPAGRRRAAAGVREERATSARPRTLAADPPSVAG